MEIKHQFALRGSNFTTPGCRFYLCTKLCFRLVFDSLDLKLNVVFNFTQFWVYIDFTLIITDYWQKIKQAICSKQWPKTLLHIGFGHIVWCGARLPISIAVALLLSCIMWLPKTWLFFRFRQIPQQCWHCWRSCSNCKSLDGSGGHQDHNRNKVEIWV